MDMNYFLKRLQAGEDMSDIGNEIAELMNEAQAAYEAEEKAKAAALAKALAEKKANDEAAKAKDEKRAALLKTMVDTIAEYCAFECPEFADAFVADEDDLKVLADSMSNIFTMIKLFGVAPADTKDTKPAQSVIKVRSDDDVLNDFIKNFLV